jgi:hypothetical protein
MASPGDQPHAIAVTLEAQAVSVVFYLVKPVRTGGHDFAGYQNAKLKLHGPKIRLPQIEALELARLSRKSRPELLGRHCSISVTDEDGAGIYIIPLDDVKPNVYPPHGLRLQSAIEATRRASRKRTRGQRRSAQYLQQPFRVRKTSILIQFCTGRTGDVRP